MQTSLVPFTSWKSLIVWAGSLHRIIGFSHGTADERIHCKWVDEFGEQHDMTWQKLADWNEWHYDDVIDRTLAALDREIEEKQFASDWSSV